MATPGYFCVVLERVGRAGGIALVEPQAEAVGVGARRLAEARLVHHPEIGPARIAIRLLPGMRGDDLQQVEGAERAVRHAVPEAVVAAGPDVPHVAAPDRRRAERHPAVHVVEIVLVGLRETTPRCAWRPSPRPPRGPTAPPPVPMRPPASRRRPGPCRQTEAEAAPSCHLLARNRSDVTHRQRVLKSN